MKAIAAAAGVTQATVSMSLSGNPRIPPATRDRIRALARSMGYRPNPYVSALMSIVRQRKPPANRPVVALVNAYESPDAWRSSKRPTVLQMRLGALERAALRGYRGEEFWLHRDGMSGERFSEMLRARGIPGLLLSPLADGAAIPPLTWEYFAAVSLSVPQPGLTITTVCNDHFFSMLQTVRECRQRGYRRPGLVMYRTHRTRFYGRWDAGYLVSRVLLDGLKLTKPLLVGAVEEAEGLLPGWLKSERPDVIIAPMADQLAPYLRQMGRRIPEDLGLAWLGCSSADHPISGVYQNGRLIGATAMDLLVNMIERHECGLPAQASSMMIEGVWNPGQTLRPRPSAVARPRSQVGRQAPVATSRPV